MVSGYRSHALAEKQHQVGKQKYIGFNETSSPPRDGHKLPELQPAENKVRTQQNRNNKSRGVNDINTAAGDVILLLQLFVVVFSFKANYLKNNNNIMMLC